MNVYEVIRRPIVTEKAVLKKDEASTLCFEVSPDANKTQIKAAVQKVFGVKVADVKTVNNARQASPARPLLRLSVGLEESVCPPRGGREDAGVHGDLSAWR